MTVLHLSISLTFYFHTPFFLLTFNLSMSTQAAQQGYILRISPKKYEKVIVTILSMNLTRH